MTTPPPARDWALFLDVDGTLLDFRPDPVDVRADARLVGGLLGLHDALDGALAIVSGRALDSLDAVFGGAALPAAGLHGLQRRTRAGRVAAPAIRPPPDAHARLDELVREAPRLRLEDKGASLAVHWREAPEFEPAARAALAAALAAAGPAWHLQPGACVLELKPRAATKADAVRAFMAEPPFAGRRPVYVGDDLTDLDGFAAAEALGGEAIAVGARVGARWRLRDPAAVRAWLAGLRDALAPGATAASDAAVRR